AMVPSGRILPSRSFSRVRKSPMVCARRPRRGKRSAAAVSSDLASAARSSRRKRSKISLGSRLAPSMRSLWTAGSTSGRPEKSMRIAAPGRPLGPAGCGRVAARRYSTASPASARSSARRAPSACGATFSSSRRPSGLKMYRPNNWRRASNSSTAALVFKRLSIFSAFAEGLFNHRQGALGDLELGQIAEAHPFHRAYIVAGSERSTHDAAHVVDEHVVILGGAGGIAHDALEYLQYAQRTDFEAGLLAHLAADGVGQRLAGLQRAAGQRPPANQRLLAALRHEDAVALQNERAHANDRARGITAVVE